MSNDDPHIARLAEAVGGSVPKLFRRGTHRTKTPEATLACVKPYARRMGITRLGNVTGLDRIGIPVTIAVRPNSRSFSVSQGKGANFSQAFASALMEAVELFHAEDIDDRTTLASFRDLSAQACVAMPCSLGATGGPLPEALELAWIQGYDLLQRERCWVPWEVVHTDYTLSSRHTGDHFLSGTDGLAAGNHLVEAISAGICELIEHDAVALWHALDIRARARCRLNAASVDDEDCCALLAKYNSAQIRPRLWDVTSDIGIPAFVCDIPAETDNPSGGLRRFRGAGCHPSRAIALARALTEAAQIRLTYISGIRDDLLPSDYKESPQQRLGAALLDAVSQSLEPRSFSDVPSLDENDLALDLQWELKRLQAVGISRVIAVDLTRPDFGIPVVRVVIPGLESACTHPNYRPGRRARRAGRHSQ